MLVKPKDDAGETQGAHESNLPLSHTGPGRNLRLLVVDDKAAFRQMTMYFFQGYPWIEVIGTAADGAEAIAQSARLHPDLILMDFAMPVLNGMEATLQIKKLPAAPRIIILTLHDIPAYRDLAQKAGADGYVVKTDFGESLVRLILQMFSGSFGTGGTIVETHDN